MSDLDLIAAFVVSLGLAAGAVGALANLGALRLGRHLRQRREQRQIDRQFAEITRRYR